MKFKIAVALSCFLGAINLAYAKLDFQMKELPADRTSMEYGSEIKALEKVIAGYKWQGELGSGFEITSMPNFNKSATDEYTVKGLFFEVKRYYYDKVTKTSVFYARQSERVGYVEFVDIEERTTMNVKVDDADTIELVEKANESRENNRLIYKKVVKLESDPNNKGKLKSAKDSGMVF